MHSAHYFARDEGKGKPHFHRPGRSRASEHCYRSPRGRVRCRAASLDAGEASLPKKLNKGYCRSVMSPVPGNKPYPRK
jgi:hypothetical protein